MSRERFAELLNAAGTLLEGVPDHVWDGESLPVPIEDIADSHLGLLVRDVDEMADAPGLPPLPQGASISGLLLPALREIWVNALETRRWPLRRRYTIAHEIGHWVLHRDSQGAVRCRAEAVRPDEVITAEGGVTPDGRPQYDIEWEANAFGGGLLIPPRLLRAHWDGDERRLDQVSEAFQISESALRGRADIHLSRARHRFGH